MKNDACILLEQKMEKDMIWLACCCQIMLEAIVFLSVGPSKSPDIMIFKQFQSKWSIIYKTSHQVAVSDNVTCNCASNIDKDMVVFARNQLQEFQLCDDYKELLELTIIFLAGIPTCGVSFKTPAGLRQTWWMAKAIYSFKIWMLRSQFKLSKREECGI